MPYFSLLSTFNPYRGGYMEEDNISDKMFQYPTDIVLLWQVCNMCLDVLDIRNSSPLLVFGGGVVLWNRLSLAIDLTQPCLISLMILLLNTTYLQTRRKSWMVWLVIHIVARVFWLEKKHGISWLIKSLGSNFQD